MPADDLAAWLTQIWDERERLAKKATPGPWRHDPRKHWRKPGTAWFEEAVFAGPAGKDATCVAGTGESDDPQSIYDAAFIAANDPATVLARIAADRQILAAWQYESGIDYAMGDGGSDSGLLFALKCIAAAYADRSGYRDEWAPRDCRHCKPHKERHAYDVYCRETGVAGPFST